jgi:hypothetical protein
MLAFVIGQETTIFDGTDAAWAPKKQTKRMRVQRAIIILPAFLTSPLWTRLVSEYFYS